MKACFNITIAHVPTFIIDSWTLRDCIQSHTPLDDEVGSYLTGQRLGEIFMLSRICPVQARVQSPVRFIGTHQSSASRLIEILENGNRLHATFHSHPGSGPAATQPSAIDLRYMAKLQSRGAKILGLICTRDGYVRAYSPLMPFLFIVQGNGVEQVDGEDYVFKVQIENHKN